MPAVAGVRTCAPGTPGRGAFSLVMRGAFPYTLPCMQIQILPSLLAADLGRLGDELRRTEASGADAVHLDVMDAHFVPNLSYGPDVVALSRATVPGLYRHVHLMMTRPDRYVDAFAAAGAQTIQVHVEADADVHATIARIAAAGAKPAIVLNPETPAHAAAPYIGETDEILVMTVHPGRGGQKFIEECLPKIAAVRRMAGDGATVMVDGGVNASTAALAAAAGANAFVAGSYLFGRGDMKAAVAELRETCRKSHAAEA